MQLSPRPFVAVLSVVAFHAHAHAQVPSQLPVQGFLTATDGTPVDGDTSITFSLFTTEMGGAPAFTETQTVRVDEGWFTAYVGDMGTLDLAVFRDNAQVFLEIQVGGDPPMSPRLAMGTVPYAAVAQYALAGGASAGTRSVSGSVSGTTIAELDTFEVEVPGPGSLTVLLNASVFVDCDATAATSRICSTAGIGICDASADQTSCGGSFETVWHEDPDDSGALNEQHLIAIVRTVEVAAAGPRRFYLNARGPEAARTLSISGGQVIVIYTPGDPLTIGP